MKLDDYFQTYPGALTVAQLRAAIGVKGDIQIRQWRHGYAGRQPSPGNAYAVEVATNGVVRRWDLRPDDWHLIWRDLVGIEGAPPIPIASAPAPAREPLPQAA